MMSIKKYCCGAFEKEQRGFISQLLWKADPPRSRWNLVLPQGFIPIKYCPFCGKDLEV